MGERILIAEPLTRGHAFAWFLSKSSQVEKLYIAPGNPGTEALGESVSLKETDISALAEFAERKKIGLTIFPSDRAIKMGAVGVFRKRGLRAWGPTRAAGKIEWSKPYSKNLMQRLGIPTADFRVFEDYNRALSFVRRKKPPFFLKAAGLADGKGAHECTSTAQALQVLDAVMNKKVHGREGDTVVVEDYLEGPEFTAHALACGERGLMLPLSQDTKLLNGKMTGGVGAIAPVIGSTPALLRQVSEMFVRPVLQDMRRSGHPFEGCLYPGLKRTRKGFMALEYNARPGCPEWDVYVRLFDFKRFDPLDLLLACLGEGKLEDFTEAFETLQYALTVVLCAPGYPDPKALKLGGAITGLDAAQEVNGVVVFHGGTRMEDGVLRVSGGRVLSVTAVGNNLSEARERAYGAAERIEFPGKQFQSDIGERAFLAA